MLYPLIDVWHVCIYKSCIHILVSISILDLGCFGVIVCVLGEILSNSQFFWPLTIAAPDGSRKARRAVPLALCSWAARLRRFAWKSGNSMGTLGHRAGLLPKSEMLLMIYGVHFITYPMLIKCLFMPLHAYPIVIWSSLSVLSTMNDLPMSIWGKKCNYRWCKSDRSRWKHHADPCKQVRPTRLTLQ